MSFKYRPSKTDARAYYENCEWFEKNHKTLGGYAIRKGDWIRFYSPSKDKVFSGIVNSHWYEERPFEGMERAYEEGGADIPTLHRFSILLDSADGNRKFHRVRGKNLYPFLIEIRKADGSKAFQKYKKNS